MGKYEHKRWIGKALYGLPRAERRSCDYDAYIPDKLAERAFRLDGEVAADIADAEASLMLLDKRTAALAETETLARILLRAECVASSRIEGLEIAPRRLMRAEAAKQMGELPGDITAEEVLGNIDAMRAALEAAVSTKRITTDTILDIHYHLLKDTRLSDHAGRIRDVQNWIGGNEYNPCAAEFIPPPPEFVAPLLEDLSDFCNSDMLPAVAQAAIAHAQFETIHPFVDGNGRAGRALVHLLLRRRGLTTRVQPPVSLILATRVKDYRRGLKAFSYDGPPDSDESHTGINAWVGIFSAACVRAAADAGAFEERCTELERNWRDRLERIRKESSVDLILKILPGTPIISVKSVVAMTGRSKPQVNAAVARLENAGILRKVTVGRRNRAFEARYVIDIFAELERQLASPAGNTLVSPPSRPVPARRTRSSR